MDDIFTKVLQTFLGAGVAGAVLFYYLWRIGPKLDEFKAAVWTRLDRQHDAIVRLEAAMDRATRAKVLGFISSLHIAPELKDSAADIIREIDLVALKPNASPSPSNITGK